MRTVTFTMEDALISPVSFMILSGAGLIDASANKPIYIHTTEQIQLRDQDGDVAGNYTNDGSSVTIDLAENPATPNVGEDFIYVMLLDDHGEVFSEPYIGTPVEGQKQLTIAKIEKADNGRAEAYDPNPAADASVGYDLTKFKAGAVILVDYYVQKVSKAQQIDITADKFGGNYYLEASTLFRNTDGVDMPAEFIIPNCKVQSNFTFTMNNSGDPSEVKRLAA